MSCIDVVYKVVGILAALATGISVVWALKTYIFNKNSFKVQKSIDLLKYNKDKGTSNNFVILGMTPCGTPNNSAFRKINFAKACLLEVPITY